MLQEMALRTVNNMAKVIQKLLSDGKQLHDPESIQLCLEPGIRSRSEQVGCHSIMTGDNKHSFDKYYGNDLDCVIRQVVVFQEV